MISGSGSCPPHLCHPSALNADQDELMKAGWRGPRPDELQ